MPDPDSNNEKTCFVIAPIGENGSPIRTRADKVYKHIIKPSLTQCGYKKITRSDLSSEQGPISHQIIHHLVNDDLVVADLTGRNPNVYYELAARHAFQKPTIQLIEEGEARLPFDVQDMRTITVNHQDLESAETCKQQIVEAIHHIEQPEYRCENPITAALQFPLQNDGNDPVRLINEATAQNLQVLQSQLKRWVDASHKGLMTAIESLDSKLDQRSEQYVGFIPPELYSILAATSKLIEQYHRDSDQYPTFYDPLAALASQLSVLCRKLGIESSIWGTLDVRPAYSDEPAYNDADDIPF